MKICIVTEYFPTDRICDVRGGAEAVAFYEARFLAENHDTEVITSFEPGTKREDVFDKIKVFRCGKTRKYVQKNAFADRFSFLRAACFFGGKRSYDIVVGYSFIAYPAARRIAAKQSVPCVFRYHDVLLGKWVRTFGIAGMIGNLTERFVLSGKSAAIVAVSGYTADKLRKYIADPGRIFVVPNGVEIPSEKPPKEKTLRIICVSRLVRYKHVDDLLKAMAILLKSFPDLQCTIIGTGPEEQNLRRLTEKTGIADHVIFNGFVPDHRELMRQIGSSHLLCLPSCTEGFGLVVLESMACGVPFVAAEIPPLVEVTNKKGGLFYPCRDVKQLVAKITEILKDPLLQDQLGDEGRQRAEQFRWSETTGQTEAIYKKIAGERNG